MDISIFYPVGTATVVVNKKLTFRFVKTIVLMFVRYHFSTVANTQNCRRERKCASASTCERNLISVWPAKKNGHARSDCFFFIEVRRRWSSQSTRNSVCLLWSHEASKPLR